jgi:aldose 1-epimerase
VDARTDLREARPLHALQLDDALTSLDPNWPGHDANHFVGAVGHASRSGALQVWGSRSFREIVVFTPPHHQAVCIEPYTCVTDAINLQQRGIDAGLLTLAPGEGWSAVVDLVIA